MSGIAGFYSVWAGLGAAMAAILSAPAFGVVTRRFPHDFRRAIILMTLLGVPLALARAAAPVLLGLLWTANAGYSHGLWLLLALSVVAVGALMLAQRLALRAR